MRVTHIDSSEVRFESIAVSLPNGWHYKDDGEVIAAWPLGYDGAVTISSFTRDAPSRPTQQEASDQAAEFARQQGWPAPNAIEVERGTDDAVSASFAILATDDDGSIRRWRVRTLLTTRRLIIVSFNFAAGEESVLEPQAEYVIRSVREVDSV